MEILRTSVTLLSIFIFHSTLSETQGICKGNLPPVKHVAVNSNVTVPCSVLSATEMIFKLFRDKDQVTSITIQTNSTSVNKNYNIRNVPADLIIDRGDNSTSFILRGVTMNYTGLYTCEAEIIFPPPFRKVKHRPQTIVLVEERPINMHNPCENDRNQALWVMLGLLIIYGMLMSCIVFILRIKYSQINSPYKDRDCRRKWQGVQHPTWRIK